MVEGHLEKIGSDLAGPRGAHFVHAEAEVLARVGETQAANGAGLGEKSAPKASLTLGNVSHGVVRVRKTIHPDGEFRWHGMEALLGKSSHPQALDSRGVCSYKGVGVVNDTSFVVLCERLKMIQARRLGEGDFD